MSIEEQVKAEFVDHDYLGDGAYVGYTSYRAVVIFTSNGLSILNRVELDGHGLKALAGFVERMEEQHG